ncbi:MAG: NADPH:quinone oxidoreductase family protein [Acidimicrobiales bacterium]|nr:NADPH:quinone oxidoreductase family protein [Acidimicrobiales bacterium]
MRAARVVSLDGPDGIEVGDVDEPTAHPGQVVIDVEAAGITFPDLLMTRGEYQMRPEPPFVPGSQVAGTVRTAPEGSDLRPGDRVAALCGLGGLAEVATAGVDATFALPDAVSFAAASILPVNTLTAEFAFERRGRLQPGETVLVHGAAGGVGTACIQVAKAMGARVIAVTSSPEKAEVARRVGADEAIDVDGFKDAARALTDGRGVDVVLDPVGGDRFTDSLRSLATEGRLLVVGFAGGEIPTVKVNRLLLANTSVVGVAWGEYAFSHPGYLQEQWSRLLPLLASGAIDPVVGATYPLDGTADALAALAERRATGTLVVEPRR